MGAPLTAWVDRRNPSRKTGAFSPEHHFQLNARPVVSGDYVGHRERPYESDFHAVGRIRPYPGTHENHYFNIRGLQSIQERFWGFIRPLRAHLATIPRGAQEGPFMGGANIEIPPSTTHGSFATVVGDGREAIRNGYAHTMPGR